MEYRIFKRKINTVLKLIGLVKKTEEDITKSKFYGAVVSGDPNLVTIADQVSFGGNVLLFANAPIDIGGCTIIACNVIFHTSTHDHDDHPMWLKRIDRPIRVGKHVWIGTGVIILAGIIIGDYAVVAAGSVVCANVPEGAIVAGNPARIIKMRDPAIYSGKPAIALFEQNSIEKRSYGDTTCKKK